VTNLTIGTWNVFGGLTKIKTKEINRVLLEKGVECCFIQEPKQTEEGSKQWFFPDFYHYHDLDDEKKEGVILLVRKTLNRKLKIERTKNTIHINTEDLQITGVYCPPQKQYQTLQKI
jgi:exonuclease III